MIRTNDDPRSGIIRKTFLLIREIFAKETRSSVLLSVLAMICSSGASELGIFNSGQLISRFYVVLGGSDYDGFIRILIESIGWFLFIAFMKALLHFSGGYFSLLSRKVLSKSIQERFFSEEMFNSTLLDNPDQRISQDVDNFTQSLRNFMEKLIISPFMISFYVYKSVTVAGWLSVGIIFAYFFAGTIVCRLVAYPLITIIYNKERLEGHYRYQLLRCRHFSEAIALLRGYGTENANINYWLDTLLKVQRKVLLWDFLLKDVTEFIARFGGIVSYIVIAFPVFAGAYKNVPPNELASIIAINSFYCMYLINKLTDITDTVNEITNLAGFASRLYSFFDFKPSALYMKGSHIKSKDCVFKCEGLSVMRLDGVCINVPDLEINRNTLPYLIALKGDPGCGKSTLIKAMFGMIDIHSGSLEIDESVFVFPQVPYVMAYSTLNDQITYPDEYDPSKALEVAQIVRLLELDKLLQREDLVLSDALSNDAKAIDWNSYLSPGEKQKICLARVLYHKPTVVLVDEGTNSVDEHTEQVFFEELRRAKILCIWATHTIRTPQLPDAVLTIRHDGHMTLDIDSKK